MVSLSFFLREIAILVVGFDVLYGRAAWRGACVEENEGTVYLTLMHE